MTYQKTIEYLFSRLPVYQRIGPAAYKTGLDNTVSLCNLLDNPQNNFPSVHIAGTNGKGSVSHFIASILQAKGMKVGLYTSPHLKDFRERIKINGKYIPQKYVTDFVGKNKQQFEDIGLSFFEMTVGLAFRYFYDEKVDIAVIEVGLGGRLDSTNIINPLLSVITNISFDHMALLGDTLPQIAEEKAGIIKKQIPVVIGETQQEIKDVFLNKAKEMNSPIWFADKCYQMSAISYQSSAVSYQLSDINNKSYSFKVLSPMLGDYQKKNIVTVVKAFDILNTQGYEITEGDIIKGIKDVLKNTGLMGRWQILGELPLTICDVAHNEAGIKEVVEQIKQIKFRKLHFVYGVVNDKEIDHILELLPTQAEYYFCRADIPRGLDSNILNDKAAEKHLKGNAYESVKKAFEAAKANAGKDDLVFVGGSVFVVAEIL